MGNDCDIGKYTLKDRCVIDYVIATANYIDKVLDFVETDHILSDGDSILYLGVTRVEPNSQRRASYGERTTWKMGILWCFVTI